MKEPAAVLIIAAECAPSVECGCDWCIGNTGDSNADADRESKKETPATPSADCKNARRSSVRRSFDFFFITRSQTQWSRTRFIPEMRLCQSRRVGRSYSISPGVHA